MDLLFIGRSEDINWAMNPGDRRSRLLRSTINSTFAFKDNLGNAAPTFLILDFDLSCIYS